MLPHTANVVLKMMRGALDKAHPREDSDVARTKLSAYEYALTRRLKNAGMNGLENLPLFASAVLANHICGVDESLIAKDATMVLMLRMVYNAVYAWADTENKSYIRSGIFFYTTFAILRMFGRCFRRV
ncbi:hypothetical protein DFJ74DRAFT_714510 [Hyaloraphidium curvatum]|nr:hypothetical protein DFJ74DRAFT_714510 [Hyaloraphidium curvatum]